MFSMTRRQWANRLFSLFPVSRPAKVPRKRSGRKPVAWRVLLPEGRYVTVMALTKSEARSVGKLLLKIRVRLPIGATVEKVA